MANTTVRGALSIHGTNPQFLIEKVIRSRIYDSNYWKEQCFALTAESLIDHALKMRYVGGTYANTRPTEFLCLTLKLLQLQPEKEIILEYLRAEEFKYLRALAAFYVRLTFSPINVYQTLEPLLADYRKIRIRSMDGSYHLSTIDDFADSLLTEERVCEVILPRLTQRKVLEETEALPKRKSRLAKALGVEEMVGVREDGVAGKKRARSNSRSGGSEDESDAERYISRSPSRAGSEDSRSPPPDEEEGAAGDDGDEKGDEDRYISRSPSPDRYVSRSPTPEGRGSMVMCNSYT